MDLEAVNLSHICRTCKCNSLNMRCLFEKYENQNLYINEMLMACASVHVICGDGLPSQICEECMDRLRNAYIFKNQCEKIDASLRKYAENLNQPTNIKEELEESHFIEINTSNDLLDQQESEANENILDSTTTMVKSEPVLRCEKCNVIFLTLEDQHDHKCNLSGHIYKCKDCNREFTKPNYLQKHERRHRRKNAYVCRICGKTLVRADGLRRHLITHTRERKRPFSCKSCNRCFTRNEHLQYHVPKCKGDTVFSCNICKKSFYREDSVEFHKRIHNTEQTKLPISINPENILDHYYQIDQEENNTTSSTVFSDSCESSEDAMEHEDKIEIKEYVFNMSNIDCKSNSSESTVSVPNSQDGNNVVEEINESFESKETESNKEVKREDETHSFLIYDSPDGYVGANVRTEGSNEDTGDSTYSKYLPKENLLPKGGNGHCKLVKSSDSLVNHKVVEYDIEEKVSQIHQCKKCNKTFPSKSRLMQHLKIHNEHAKKYLCSECGQGYIRHKDLVFHMQRHTGEKPFKCKYCGKGFSRTSDVIVHERTHTGEKTHLCTICGKAFARAYNYTIHMRTHTGEKPYPCTHCDAAFSQIRFLKDHTRRKHTEEKLKCDL